VTDIVVREQLADATDVITWFDLHTSEAPRDVVVLAHAPPSTGRNCGFSGRSVQLPRAGITLN